MRRARSEFVLSIALLGLTSAACDDKNGGSPLSTGLDKSAELGSLSPADADKLCKEVGDWTRKNLDETLCRLSGFIAAAFLPATDDTQLQNSCKTAYDMCLKDGTSSCEKPSATCKATVGEMEACLNALVPLFQDALKGVPSCSQLSRSSIKQGPAPGGSTLEDPPACQALQQKCPEMGMPSLPD